MRAKIQKLTGVFPVTLDKAVYVSGTKRTIKEEIADIKSVIDVSPEMFGAKGNGTDDDTTFIQQAIDSVSNGGVVRLRNNYKITSSLVMKRGVHLLGTNDGTFTNKSRLLVAIGDNSPAIKFETITTGIKIENIYIKPFDESFKKKFVGIEFTNSEYTNVDKVEVDGALYGFHFSASTKSNYLVRCDQISAINCDIGIYFSKAESESWSNGIYICPKEVSLNRIGILAEQGSGNTIEGKNTEIGKNTECGIRISDGTYTLKGNLWLEGTPSGIEVLNKSTIIIDGELYNIKPIKKDPEAIIINNARQAYINIIQNKLNYNGIKAWFSFDNEDGKVINYVDGEVYDNTGGTLYQDGIYGHSSTLKNQFGLNQLSNIFKPNESWTMMLLMKSLVSENGATTMFTIQDDARTGLLFFDNNILNNMSITNVRSDKIGSSNNLGQENSNVNNYSWIILQYDADTLKLHSFNSIGKDVLGTSEMALDLTGYSQCRLMNFKSQANICYDEIIIYNRKLSSDEIANITGLSSIPSDLKTRLINNKLKTVTSYPVLEQEVGVVNKEYPYGDVKRYGAIKITRDESIDDTQFFQNAIDSAYALGKEVIVSNGIYTIKNSILLPKVIKIVGKDNKVSYRGQTDGTVIETYSKEVFKPKSGTGCQLYLTNLYIFNRESHAVLFSGFNFSNTFITKNSFHAYDIVMLSTIGGGNSRFSDNDIQQVKQSCFCKKPNIEIGIETEAPPGGIVDATIENNYINGFTGTNAIAFDGTKGYSIASSKIINNYIDFFKYAFLSPQNIIYSGNVIDYCFRGFAGYMKGAIIESNHFFHIKKDAISKFRNPDEQMQNQDWICINTSAEDGDQMDLSGSKITVTNNIIDDCDIFYNAIGFLLSGVKILHQNYLQDTIVKVKTFTKNGEWNSSDTDNLNDIMIEPLMGTEVESLPDPKLTGKTVNMFNGREVKYQGKIYKNIDGVWVSLVSEYQTSDVSPDEIMELEP